MEKLFLLAPEIAGGLGPRTVITNHPQLRSGEAVSPAISHLEYCFDDWSGDELLAVSPCYIVTETVAGAMIQAKLTGVRFDSVEVTTSGLWQQIKELYPGRLPDLPPFRRLIPEGEVEFTSGGGIVRWTGHDVNRATSAEAVPPDLDALLGRVGEALRGGVAGSGSPPPEETLRSVFAGTQRRQALAVTTRCLALLRRYKLDQCVVEELHTG